MDDLLGGHLDGDGLRHLVEILDEPIMVDHPWPSGNPTKWWSSWPDRT